MDEVYTVTNCGLEGDHVVYTLVDDDGSELEFSCPIGKAPHVGKKYYLRLIPADPAEAGILYSQGTK